MVTRHADLRGQNKSTRLPRRDPQFDGVGLFYWLQLGSDLKTAAETGTEPSD